MGEKYFAAQNSGIGFVSYFSENLRSDRAKRCYIIKGGPGTGKARLMSEIAAAAEKRGADVEYYYCSSDPTSLDGVFITLENGSTLSVIDGTSPHDEDAIIAGARDDLIDLGAFWDSGVLFSRREEIESLLSEKANAMRRAYSCLAAAGALYKSACALRASCADKEGITLRAKAVASALLPTRGMRSPLSSVGMKGCVRFDSFRRAAKRVVAVNDSKECPISYLFFGAIRDMMHGKCRSSPDLLLPEHCEGVLCGDTAVIPFAVDEEVIELSSCVDLGAYSKIRDEVSELESAKKAAFAAAQRAFSDVADAHFALESIYSSAMDFSKKEAHSAYLCDHILA